MTTATDEIRTGTRRPLDLLVVVGLLASCLALVQTVAQPTTVRAATTSPIISTFYVPLYEDNAYNALYSVNPATGAALSSTTSLSIAAEGTVVYYDEWEDGYEGTLGTPVQASTLIFGDGIISNGDASTYCVPARCAGDVLPSGAVLRLNNSTTATPGSLAIPRAAGTVRFDGRDKIGSTAGLAVSHATWPTNTDALHAQMAAAFDTSRWGVNFVAPVGTNTPQQGGDGTDHFSYSGLEVMAKEAGTVVSIDVNADGDLLDAVDVNATTIGEGQTVFVNGGVSQGARITSSKAVQAFLMTGRIGSNYADRSFQLFPTEGLVNSYIAPASAAAAADDQASVLYIFNPQSSAITVTVTTSSGSTNYTVPAGQILNPAPFLGVNQPAQVTSASTFAALAATGTREGAAAQNYDWGYSLVPSRLLSTSVNVGWAPGSQDLTSAVNNPVWVTTNGATTLYVDFDGDPTTGANLDPNGSRYDSSFVVSGALTLTKVTDSGDNDMTGARIYTLNGVTLAAAYGEDPANAPLAFPGIDLGTALFPSCGTLCVQKSTTLADDADGDGQVDPGDMLEWTVRATNTGYYTITNAVLKDILPAGVTYVSGSTTVGGTALADDIVPPSATSFAFDESGRNLGTIAVGGSITVVFRATVNNPYDGPVTSKISNTAVVLADQAGGTDTSALPLDSLRLTKTSDAALPVTVGDTLAYTLTASNAGSSTLTSIAIADTLPAGLTWVSTSVTRPTTSTSTVADDFQSAGYAGSTGTLGWSQASWQEVNDSTTTPIATTGQVRNFLESSSQRIRFIGAASNHEFSRIAGDLSSYTAGARLQFDYKRSGLEATDAVTAEIRPNGSAAWTALATYSGGTDAAYVAASFDVTNYIGTATQVRFRVTNALDDNSDIWYVDNVVLSVSNRVVSTVAGSAPPALVTLTDLRAGESATVVITTTVTATPDPDIVNTATATSGSFVTQARVADCALCFDFGDVPATYDTGNAGRARAVGSRVTLNSTIIDDFENATTFDGSTGTVAWSDAAWAEIDASGLGVSAGRLQKATDAGDLSAYWMNSSQASNELMRVAGDLTGYTSATLSLDKRCVGLESGDVVDLQIRPTAAAGWVTLQSYTSCNDAAYVAQSFPLTASTHYGSATAVRLRVSNAFGGTAPDNLYIDNVRFDLVSNPFVVAGPTLGANFDRELTAASAASGAAPTGDDTTGSPDDEDGVTVPPVNSNTVTVDLTVVDPTGGVTYVNGWFDWDANGVFDATEGIFSSPSFASATGGMTVVGGVGAAPGPGTYSVVVNVPDLSANGSGFVIGNSVYARFRVATNGSEITAAKARGASSDGEVEDYRATLNTLPVSLSYVASSRGDDGTVDVSWRTAQEVDNLGFEILASDADGTLTTVSDEIVLAVAPTSVTPQTYHTVVATTSRTLWVQDVALDGTRSLHGPYRVGTAYGDPSPPAPIDWSETHAEIEAAAADRAASAQDAAGAVARSARTNPLASIDVTESGIQEITFEQLRDAGVDLGGMPARSLAIRGPEGPVAVEAVGAATFGPGSSLRFVGAPVDTTYSDTAVYHLRIDAAGARPVVAQRSTTTSSSTRPSRSHRATVRIEHDTTYSITSPVDDPWYDRMALAFNGSTGSTSMTVHVSDLAPGSAATASVDLWGITNTATADEHHARLSLNGVTIAEMRFDDLDAATLRGSVPVGVLVEGANEMTVTLIGDSGEFIDVVAIDSWSISHRRANVAIDGRLDFRSTAGRITVNGLSDGEVLAYRVGRNGQVVRLVTTPRGGGVQFDTRPTAARYVVLDRSAVVTPEVAAQAPPADLLSGDADYLVITNGIFLDSLNPLVAAHESLGRTVRVVDVADVYDQYNGGVVDAHAIDDYVAQAVPALGVRWLLLVGADSIDYRDVDNDGSVSLVPSLYGPTGFGITHAPLDPAYADVDGDGGPDVAMGRLPARTTDELNTMIDKTLALLDAPSQRSVLLVSDAADGTDYAAVNDDLANRFDGWDVTRADVDRHGVEDARARLIGSIDAGVGLTLYTGHSGTHEWGWLGLFDAASVSELTNADRPGVVAQFGCWNTYYVGPMDNSMSQSLLDSPTGGAAAVLGAATLTSATNDTLLASYLVDAVVDGPSTIGEALLVAKDGVAGASDGSTVDVQLGFTLLGDPAIPVPGGR